MFRVPMTMRFPIVFWLFTADQSSTGESRYNTRSAQNANSVHRRVLRSAGLVKLWLCSTLFLLAIGPRSATAQWLHYPSAGIPRTADGNPDLSAPTPRSPDGTPDLSGLWTSDKPATQDGPLFEFRPGDVILTSEGDARQRQRRENYFPGAQCMPDNLPRRTAVLPFKILTFRGTVVVLYEENTTYRQIFLDGRELPKDPNPTWMGYSVGKWDGDTLVVDTSGFNDDEWILPGRRPHSDALHIIERYRRPDFGHLEIQYTIDDPKVYAKPWTMKQVHHLIPDTELLEYICNENEKDLPHMVGSDR